MTNLPETLPDGSEYDPETETLTIPVDVDVDDGDIAQAVVLGVEALTEETVATLDPLASAVDPDALNALFEDRAQGPSPQSWVSFPYHGCRVTTYSDGLVEIEPIARDER